jgi:type II secretory pathway component GspD/PulD (secretin)
MKKTLLILFVVTLFSSLYAEGTVNKEAVITESIKIIPQKNADKTEILKNFTAVHNKKINVQFQQTDIKTVLKFFSTEFDLNIISGPDVEGEISFSLSEVNPIDAFNAILATHGYSWMLENNIIKVYIFHPVEAFDLNYAPASEVEVTIKQLLSKEASISIDTGSNSIIIKAPFGDLEKIRPIIKGLDSKPRQVLVEVQIIEVQEEKIKSIGFDLSYKNQESENESEQQTSSKTGLTIEVLKNSISATLEAIKTNSDIDILARPKILAINHKPASLITGQRLGYKTSISSATTGMVSESVNFLDVGTKLTFTPHIAENGDILMEIKPEISEGTISAEGLPNETTTETETSVLVKDGQTILIGGLIRNKKTNEKYSIPLLSDIPFLGNLFKNEYNNNQKVETIVLITPHLITYKKMQEIINNNKNIKK